MTENINKERWIEALRSGDYTDEYVPLDRMRPDDTPGITLCGYPKPGDIIWYRDLRYEMCDDGYMYRIDESDIVIPAVTFGEKVAAKLLCPACFLPRFIPGHRFRGCEWR